MINGKLIMDNFTSPMIKPICFGTMLFIPNWIMKICGGLFLKMDDLKSEHPGSIHQWLLFLLFLENILVKAQYGPNHSSKEANLPITTLKTPPVLRFFNLQRSNPLSNSESPKITIIPF